MDKDGQGLLICVCSLGFLTFLVVGMVIFAVNTKKLAAESENDTVQGAANATTAATNDSEAGAHSMTTWIYTSVYIMPKEGNPSDINARAGRRRPLAGHRTKAGSGKPRRGSETGQETNAVRRKSTEPIARLDRTTPARTLPKVAPKSQTTPPSTEVARTVHTTPRTSATTPAESATSPTTAHAKSIRSAMPYQEESTVSATRNTTASTASETENQLAAVLTRVIINAMTLKKGPAGTRAGTQTFARATRKTMTDGTRTVHTTPRTSATTPAEFATPPTKAPTVSATRNMTASTASETENQPAAILTRVIINAMTLKKGPAGTRAGTKTFARTTRKTMTAWRGALSKNEVSMADDGTAQKLATTPPALPLSPNTAPSNWTSTKDEAGTSSVRGLPERSPPAQPGTLRNRDMTLGNTELNVTSESSADEPKRFSRRAPLDDPEDYDYSEHPRGGEAVNI